MDALSVPPAPDPVPPVPPVPPPVNHPSSTTSASSTPLTLPLPSHPLHCLPTSSPEVDMLDTSGLKTKLVISSFRDVVTGASRWFDEATSMAATILEWNDEDIVVPSSHLVVNFSQ